MCGLAESCTLAHSWNMGCGNAPRQETDCGACQPGCSSPCKVKDDSQSLGDSEAVVFKNAVGRPPVLNCRGGRPAYCRQSGCNKI